MFYRFKIVLVLLMISLSKIAYSKCTEIYPTPLLYLKVCCGFLHVEVEELIVK